MESRSEAATLLVRGPEPETNVGDGVSDQDRVTDQTCFYGGLDSGEILYIYDIFSGKLGKGVYSLLPKLPWSCDWLEELLFQFAI